MIATRSAIPDRDAALFLLDSAFNCQTIQDLGAARSVQCVGATPGVSEFGRSSKPGFACPRTTQPAIRPPKPKRVVMPTARHRNSSGSVIICSGGLRSACSCSDQSDTGSDTTKYSRNVSSCPPFAIVALKAWSARRYALPLANKHEVVAALEGRFRSSLAPAELMWRACRRPVPASRNSVGDMPTTLLNASRRGRCPGSDADRDLFAHQAGGHQQVLGGLI